MTPTPPQAPPLLSPEEIKAEPYNDAQIEDLRARLLIRPCGDLGWRIHENECRWVATLDAANTRAKAEKERANRAEAERGVLKRQLTYQRDNNHKRNLALDALHFVWCNGGCKGGAHRWQEDTVTLEVVKAAVANTRRLVQWFINSRYRDYPNYPRSLMPQEELDALKIELGEDERIRQLEAERAQLVYVTAQMQARACSDAIQRNGLSRDSVSTIAYIALNTTPVALPQVEAALAGATAKEGESDG